MSDDRTYMLEAIDLARRAEGATAPNPMVGCVLVRDGAVIGRGFHAGPSKAHAEVAAIADAGDKASGATAFVTLEPCNHTGRTGPCSEALIAAGVAEVVYAMADPNPLAAGGAARLTAAGIRCRSGVCETEARALNRGWLMTLKHARPWIIGKSAMSLDGRIATSAGESKWITSSDARHEGHKLRWRADAVIVGAETLIADDPALTARLDERERAPLRVVLDSHARTHVGAKAFERSGRGAVLATTNNAPADRLAAFREMGVETLVLPADHDGHVDIAELLTSLAARSVNIALVEGGGKALGGFFDADLIDELHLFIAPKIIGGGRPAFGGDGVAALADAARFDFSDKALDSGDRHVIGLRRGRAV